MFPTVNPTSTEAWKELEAYFKAFKGTQMKALFARDPERFAKYSIKFEDILVDFSKNIVDDHSFSILMLLARECGLKDAITSQFTGERINKTENRPVLHTALRNRGNKPVFVDGKDVMPDVHDVLEQMKMFSESIISGSWKGYTGKPITDIVNIGIGGSDLGTLMVTEAFKH